MQLKAAHWFQGWNNTSWQPESFLPTELQGIFYFFFFWDRIPAKTSPEKRSRGSMLWSCLGRSPGMRQRKVRVPALLKSGASNVTPSPRESFPQLWLPKDPSVPLHSSVRAAPGQFDELVFRMGGGRAGSQSSNTGAGRGSPVPPDIGRALIPASN